MLTDASLAHATLQVRLALTAIDLLCAQPTWLRGIVIKAAPGPVRDAIQSRLEHALTLHRVAPTTSAEHLFGGLDTAQTLATGKPVQIEGLISRARGNALLLSAAERLPDALTHGLAVSIDSGVIDSGVVDIGSTASADTASGATDTGSKRPGFPAIIAIDESLDDEPGIADSALAERLAVHLSLPPVPLRELDALVNEHESAYQTAQHQLPTSQGGTPVLPVTVSLPDRILQDLTELALSLGIDSMHAMHACLRIARAHAAMHGRSVIADEDAVIGVQLALAPRAPMAASGLPPESEEAEGDSASNDEPPDAVADSSAGTPLDGDQIKESRPPETGHVEDTDDASASDNESTLQEQLIDAARAVLPPQVLDSLATRRRSARGSVRPVTTTGKDRGLSLIGGLRGRPAGVRPLRRGQRACRLNVLETLKAAIPYQTLRQQESLSAHRDASTAHPRLALRCSDLRVTRYRQSPRSTTVFVVDASGSAAMHRLAEAKGAAQLMLAECYIRRDRVALITFNGNRASLALPPTRSLTRARRSLQGLPGGGSTPLAAGLQAAEHLMKHLQHSGEFPVCVFMTDARGNVALNGSNNRAEAREDAEQQARRLASLEARLLFIDTAPRPREPAQQLARLMHARYLALPRSGIAALPDIVMGRA
jgi:magnesium chelatase subunit D